MAEEDNFDIDIYGDENVQEEYNGEQGNNYDASWEGGAGVKDMATSAHHVDNAGTNGNPVNADNVKNESMDVASSTQPTPPAQGTKRKTTMDDLPIDPNSTIAVQITELHWWVTEDDVRGWCARSGCEGDIQEITFNEHKVNGKSKGQVYIEFSSQVATTALKHHIDGIDPAKDPKKPTIAYHHGSTNPYKTLPKDNARRNDTRGTANERPFNSNTNPTFGGSNNYSGGNSFRGGRGNFNNRGSSMGMPYNRGGFQGGMNQMGTMGANMGMSYAGMNNGFNNFNRGGMMGGMRGGMPNRSRGGMGGSMMNPMGGMNMGHMPMGAMGMPGGMMGMSGGFQSQPHFNPGFFQGQAQGGNEWGNPHGTKRPRPNE